MLRKFGYSWQFLKQTLWFILPVTAIGMTESHLNNQRCKNLNISIESDSGAQFLSQLDVRMLLTENGSDLIMGSRLDDVNLTDLENRVKKNKLIKKCQVFRDLKGNLNVEVIEEKPLARWIDQSRQGEWINTEGKYINNDGGFFPLSDSYSARTLLVSGEFFKNENNLKTEKGELVMNLIRFLNTDPFWKAQISELDVDKDSEVSMRTVVGNQTIEMGTAETYEAKFNKLRLFYDRVLKMNWSKYSKISVKFQDQIVCE